MGRYELDRTGSRREWNDNRMVTESNIKKMKTKRNRNGNETMTEHRFSVNNPIVE